MDDSPQEDSRAISLRAAWRPLAAVIAVAMLIRAALVPLYAYQYSGSTDEAFWKLWMQAIHEDGFLNILRLPNNDYVGYHWVLWGLSWLYDWIGGPYTNTTPSLHAVVKMPSLIFDALLILAVYAVTGALAREQAGTDPSTGGFRDISPERLAITGAVVIALHPAVIYDSAVWAQVDGGITAAELVAALCIARGRPVAGWGVWTAGFLLKPHPIVLAPVLALVTLRRDGWRGVALGAGAMALVTGAVLGPWVLHGDLLNIIRIYRALFHEDLGRLSLSAWNFWWLADLSAHLTPDQRIGGLPLVTYREAGFALSMLALAVAAGYVWARPGLKGLLVGCAYLAVAFYMLPISTHERYVYPFVALLLPVVMVDRRWLALYVPLSVTSLLNLLVVAPPVQAWAGRWYDGPFTVAMTAVNIALFFAFTAVVARGAWAAVPLLRAEAERWRQRGSAAALERA